MMSIATKAPTIIESLTAGMAAQAVDETPDNIAPEGFREVKAEQAPEQQAPADAPAPETRAEEAPVEEPKEPSEAERARDASGKFTKKEIEAQAKAAKAAADPLPEGISATVGAHWNKLPAEVKNEFKRLTAENATALQKATGDLQFAKQRTQALDPVLKPLEEAAAAQGVYVPQILHNYIQWGMKIERNPQEAIALLAQKYGVNLNAPQPDQLAPEVLALVRQEAQRQLAPVHQQVQSYEQQIQQQKVAQATNALTEFSAAQDAGGQPLRPHFQKVLPMMNQLYATTKQANPQASDAQLLQATYEAACAADPEVRRQVMQAEFSAEQSKVKAEAAARAAKARAASVSPGSTPPGGNGAARSSGQSRTDSIAQQVAKFYGTGGERIS